jgi:nucleotide-binding universal stress UspA family protein
MKILLATDGSDSAKAAGDFLTRFAFPAGTEVRLLNVIRDTFLKYEEWEDWQGLSDDHRTELQEAEQLLREEREDLLSKEAERLGHTGWTCSTDVRIGQPAEEILGAAASLGTNLIVLGSVGTSGFREFHLGRVANAVLEYAPFSVLLVKPPMAAETAGTESAPLRILLAFDGSDSSRKAVDFCQSLPMGAQTEIHVLAILRLMQGFRQDVQQRLSNVWLQKKTAAKAAVESVARDEKWTTQNVTSELLESPSVTEAILDVAKQRRSDLIVLGNSGRNYLLKRLLGETALHAMDCSDRPLFLHQ